MTESTLLLGYEINAQLAKDKLQKSKGLMNRLKKTHSSEVVSHVTNAWNELESILKSEGHHCENKILYTAQLSAFSEVKSNATTIVNNSFLLSIITADEDSKFEAVKNERYVAYSKASEFEQNQFSIYLSEIESNFESQEVGVFGWLQIPTDDLAKIQKRVASNFPTNTGGELHFFEFHSDGSIFPNFADVETQRFEGKLAGNYSLSFELDDCLFGIQNLNDITTRLFNTGVISSFSKGQPTDKKKMKNKAQHQGENTSTKKTYADDFKQEVATAATKEGATLLAVANTYGISPTLVRNWKIKFGENTNPEKGTSPKNKQDEERSTSSATKVMSVGYIPSDNKADWIICGDPETSGTYELTIRISNNSATIVESEKQFSLMKSDLQNAQGEEFTSLLLSINNAIPSPGISNELFSSVWNYLNGNGSLHSSSTLVASFKDGGEFHNGNYCDGNHFYFRIQSELGGEYTEEKGIVIKIGAAMTNEITSPVVLVQTVVDKYQYQENFDVLDEVLQDIEENGAGYDELSQLGYLLDYDFSDSVLALYALKFCFDVASSNGEKDYVAELVTGVLESFDGNVPTFVEEAIEFQRYIKNWSDNQQDDDGDAQMTVKKLSDEQLQELFEATEEALNDKATFATLVSEAGGNLFHVQLDVEFNDDGTWDFIARLICEETVSLSDASRETVEDKLEEIGDELYSDFEKCGLDPQMMGDYRVEVTTE